MSDPRLPARRTGGAMATPDEQRREGEALAVELINARRGALAAILPRSISVDRFRMIVFSAFRSSPKLLECDAWSVLGATMAACKIALIPNTPAGLSYLVPLRRNRVYTCELWLGYQGARVLACRDGDVGAVWGRVVYENDPVFRVVEGSEPRLEHVPLVAHADQTPVEVESDGRTSVDPRGGLVAAYAVARYRDLRMGTHFAVMPRIDVIRIRDMALGSKSNKTDSPWVAWEDRMWVKTAIKRLCKDLTLPDEARDALELDSLAEAGKDQGLGERFRELPKGDVRVAVPGQRELEPAPNSPEDMGGFEDLGGWSGAAKRGDGDGDGEDVSPAVAEARQALDAYFDGDGEDGGGA